MWTLAFGHHTDRTPTHGYEAKSEELWQHWPRVGGGSSGTVSARRPSRQSCAEEIKPTEAQRKGNQNAIKTVPPAAVAGS
jgi:hypothetical protein